MPLVELLHFPGCPHVAAARAQLVRAFAAIEVDAAWTEIDVSAASAPEHLRGYGSPTILVNGRDVTGAPPDGGSSCRVYAASEVPGAPPLDVLVATLRAAYAPSVPEAPSRAVTTDSSKRVPRS